MNNAFPDPKDSIIARVINKGGAGNESDADILIKKLYGLTAHELLYCKPAWKLLSRQPCEVPQRPSLDLSITCFLREFGIDIQPPVNPIPPSMPIENGTGNAMIGGAMGALGGPLAVGIQSHLSQQQEAMRTEKKLSLYATEVARFSAAQQEWTSWKMWALGHKDWEQFYAKHLDEWEEECMQVDRHNQDFEEWIQSEDGLLEREELAKLIQNYKSTLENDRVKKKQVDSTFSAAITLGFVLAGTVVTIEKLRPLAFVILTAIFIALIHRQRRSSPYTRP